MQTIKRALSTVSIIVFIAPIVVIGTMLTIPCTPVYAEETESECWAVIVGVSDYQYIDDLSYADNDAQSLAGQLSPVWGDDHIKLLTDSMATRQDIGDAITNWLDPRENEDDTVLFFFSGHGSRGYICPYDSLQTSYANDINAYQLSLWLHRLESRNIIVIIDSCYSGSFIYVLSDSNRVIMTSSEIDETSSESQVLGHGVFTHFVLQAIDEFDSVDTNGDYILSAEEIYYYAATEVVEWTATNGESQHPIASDGYYNELVFLIKFIFNVEPQSLYSIDLLFIDDNAYSDSTELIWAPGSIHNLSVIPVYDTGIDTRYVFTSWGDGNTSASRLVSDGGEYRADYGTEHRLTIESVYGQPQGAGWYGEGSTAIILSIASIEEPTVRHNFSGWSGDYTGSQASASIIMTGPKTVTAEWQNEYLLTIESAYGQPQGGGWYDEGSTASISIASVQEPTARHNFIGWSGDYTGSQASASIIMTSPKTVTADRRNEYLLTIESAHGQPEGAGWYDEGSTATISVSERQGIIIRKIFTGWSGNLNRTTATASFTVNSPMVVTANWRTDYLQLYPVIIGIAVILGAFGVWFIIRRRRTARILLQETIQPPTPPMRCANCGAELEPGDSFCNKCGQPVKGN
jgi:hypothetical protein